MKTSNIIAYCFTVLAFAGCERDDIETGIRTVGEQPLLFTAGIAHEASLDVTTRSWTIPDDSITTMKEMDKALGELLKKTFNYSTNDGGVDVIRIVNVRSGEEVPKFDLNESNVYQYICKEHNNNGFDDVGSDEEDKWAQQVNGDTLSEYTFVPDTKLGEAKGSYGFYINNLINAGDNYFRFYAMWWREFSPQGEKAVPASIIKTDQSTKDSLLNSDLMLAIRGHSLNNPYDTIRFTFFHVFSLLDVRISLPVFIAGNKEGAGDTLPSGYKQDEIKMEMMGIPLDYDIPHSGSFSSNQKLLLTANVEAGARFDTVPMYCYYIEDEMLPDTDPEAGHTEKDDVNDESSKSQYRTYGFCGIMPPITISWEGAQTTEARPLLRLTVKDPLSGEDKRYTYTPRQSDSNPLTLAGGAISEIRLRLSRTADDMLVLWGNILPWTDAEAEIFPTPDNPI